MTRLHPNDDARSHRAVCPLVVVLCAAFAVPTLRRRSGLAVSRVHRRSGDWSGSTPTAGAWIRAIPATRCRERTSIRASNVSRLVLKWTHALASYSPRSMPLVTEDTVFVGDGGRGLLALDRETGCVRWEFPHAGEIGSAILHQRTGDGVRLFFADRQQGIFAVDARDGSLVWRGRPDIDNPVPLYSGTPLVHRDTLFVPLSSQEIGLAAVPFYRCCHTRGGLAAMDAADGETRWYLPTIDEPARTTGRRWLTIKKRGPSGAPVWGAPAFDERRRRCLLRDRTELQPPDHGHERCDLRRGRGYGSAALGAPVHRERRLQRRLRHLARASQLSASPRSRSRLRCAAGAGGRRRRYGYRHRGAEVRRRARPQSRRRDRDLAAQTRAWRVSRRRALGYRLHTGLATSWSCRSATSTSAA